MARTLGLGTVIAVDDDDSGSGYTNITLAVTGQPPPRERQRIDGTTLGDTLATYVFGIEVHSQFTFEVDWEPNDTQSAMMETLFNAKSQVLWKITYPSADVETFDAVVTGIEPQGITTDGLLKVRYTIDRMAAHTWT